MPKQPLTPDGVAAKVAALYALPDADLYAEAHLVCGDFRAWISDNFILEEEQQKYLAEMPTGVNNSFGAALAAALIGRGKITMKPLPDEHRRTKEIKCGYSGSTRYRPPRDGNPEEAEYIATLDFSFEIPEG